MPDLDISVQNVSSSSCVSSSTACKIMQTINNKCNRVNLTVLIPPSNNNSTNNKNATNGTPITQAGTPGHNHLSSSTTCTPVSHPFSSLPFNVASTGSGAGVGVGAATSSSCFDVFSPSVLNTFTPTLAGHMLPCTYDLVTPPPCNIINYSYPDANNNNINISNSNNINMHMLAMNMNMNMNMGISMPMPMPMPMPMNMSMNLTPGVIGTSPLPGLPLPLFVFPTPSKSSCVPSKVVVEEKFNSEMIVKHESEIKIQLVRGGGDTSPCTCSPSTSTCTCSCSSVDMCDTTTSPVSAYDSNCYSPSSGSSVESHVSNIENETYNGVDIDRSPSSASSYSEIELVKHLSLHCNHTQEHNNITSNKCENSSFAPSSIVPSASATAHNNDTVYPTSLHQHFPTLPFTLEKPGSTSTHTQHCRMTFPTGSPRFVRSQTFDSKPTWSGQQNGNSHLPSGQPRFPRSFSTELPGAGVSGGGVGSKVGGFVSFCGSRSPSPSPSFPASLSLDSSSSSISDHSGVCDHCSVDGDNDVHISHIHTSSSCHAIIPYTALPSRDGLYSREQRYAKLLRYREKRARRVWNKRVLYQVRKTFADGRPRVGGRFIKKTPEEVEAAKAAKKLKQQLEKQEKIREKEKEKADRKQNQKFIS